MHKPDLVDTLIEQIETVAAEHEAQRVCVVHVWLGALSPLRSGHFYDRFRSACMGTVAENALLKIEDSDNVYHVAARDVELLTIGFQSANGGQMRWR